MARSRCSSRSFLVETALQLIRYLPVDRMERPGDFKLFVLRLEQADCEAVGFITVDNLCNLADLGFSHCHQ